MFNKKLHARIHDLEGMLQEAASFIKSRTEEAAEANTESATLRAKLELAEERADFFKRQYNELKAERAKERAANPINNIANLAAMLDEDDDEPPVEGAMLVDGMNGRIAEIWGDALSVDQLIERQKAYEESMNG